MVVLLAVVFGGCGSYPFYSTEVVFKYDNRTGAVLCTYPSSPDASSGRCLAVVASRDKTTWGSGCGKGTKDEVNGNPITVVITVKEGGLQIYRRTASCGEWKDTERKFVIEQASGEFVVTDSLPGVSPNP